MAHYLVTSSRNGKKYLVGSADSIEEAVILARREYMFRPYAEWVKIIDCWRNLTTIAKFLSEDVLFCKIIHVPSKQKDNIQLTDQKTPCQT